MKPFLLAIALAFSASSYASLCPLWLSFPDDFKYDEYGSTESWNRYVGSKLQSLINAWAGHPLQGRTTLLARDGMLHDTESDCFLTIEGGREDAKILLSIPGRNVSKIYTIDRAGFVSASYSSYHPTTMTYSYEGQGLSFGIAGNFLVAVKSITSVLFPAENGESYLCKLTAQ